MSPFVSTVIAMTEFATDHPKDLLSSRRAAWLIWGAPWALIIVSGSIGDTARTVFWPLGVAAAGAACVVNARRCGRRHYFYMWPLYLLAALASLLYGLNVVQIGIDGWNWILGVTLIGAFFFVLRAGKAIRQVRGGPLTGHQPSCERARPHYQ